MVGVLVGLVVLLALGSSGKALADSKIAYQCDGVDPAPDNQLCVSNMDGSDAVQLTSFSNPSVIVITDISWAANGSEIFFSVTQMGQQGHFESVFKIDSNGTNLQLVDLDPPIFGGESWGLTSFAIASNVPNNVASISPFGQFVIVFLLGGATALYLNRKPESVGV